jgi:hypothetical protein
LKFASLPKHVRYLPAIFIVSIFVMITSVAHATITCTKVDEFPVASDPTIRKQLETHLETVPGLGDYQIRQIDSRFFVVASEDEKCKDSSLCYYRLLDLRNGAVRDVIAFQGTGRVWMVLSPTATRWELLQDDYSDFAFETRDSTYLGLKLPSWGNTVFVVPQSPEHTNMFQRICGGHPK